MSFEKAYTVYADGKPLTLEKARVSKVPFNRHWPGRQRQIEQTELTAFVSFELKNTTVIRIECEFDFENVVIRPLSLGIAPVIEGRTVSFLITRACQAVVEFDGIGGALHLFAEAHEQKPVIGENTLYFGKGVHYAGRIELKSGQTVYIDEGAVVYGEIYGTDIENVSISGKGILDHSRTEPVCRENGFVDPIRPSPIMIEYGRNVKISGIIIRDSCFLSLWMICCENIHINRVKIIGNWRYNSDGIDLVNCRHALVENCFVRSFDDSFCIKGFASPYVHKMKHNGTVYDMAEDIVFRNCVAFNDWGKALEVGVDLCADEIAHCRFENCDVIHATGPAMDISNVDYAAVHDITFKDIRVEYDGRSLRPVLQERDEDVYIWYDDKYIAPLIWVKVYFDEAYSSKGERGKISDVVFDNIRISAPEMPGTEIVGFDDEHNVSNIKLTGFYMNGERISSAGAANITVGDHTGNVIFE